MDDITRMLQALADALLSLLRPVESVARVVVEPVTSAIEGVTMTDRRRKVVDLASSQVGKPYTHAEVRLDDPDPPGFDCSELVQWVYAQAGLSIVDGARAQYRACEPITPERARPGDLVFLADVPSGGNASPETISHVGIVGYGGTIIEASKSAGHVRSDRTVRQWQSWPSYAVLAGRHPNMDE